MANRQKNSFTIYETRTHLSSLLKRVQGGEELVIANGHTPVAKLVPFDLPEQKRKPGSAKGMFVMQKDFDEPLPQHILRHFGK